MPFFTIGLNHHSAPVELRERVAFTPDKLVASLQQFRNMSDDGELVIVSTCNRTELYLRTSKMNAEDATNWLAEAHNIPAQDITTHLVVHEQIGAVEHLMKVACGLDSLILGEPQILGQVKQSYTEAKRVGTVGSHFEKLFQTTFAVAKQVRSETNIGASAVSVAFAAVKLTKQIFSDIDESDVLLVGAGETIELVALLLDLAVPRDIEGEVSDLDDVYLYTVDDLHDIIEQNLAQREQAAEQASEMRICTSGPA